jgi:hypothetical protein
VKFTVQLASLILAVKHSLCYWISNKPSRTFSKLQYTPKFNDNQRITDTDIRIFVCIFVHICVYFFHMCYMRFDAYPNDMHIQIIVKNNLFGKKKGKKKQ